MFIKKFKNNDRQKEAHEENRKIKQNKINASAQPVHPGPSYIGLYWQSLPHLAPRMPQTHPHDNDDRLPPQQKLSPTTPRPQLS
jgi:hypothetical protein